MSTITGAVGSEVLTVGVALPAATQTWQAVEPTINFAPQLGSAKRIDTDDDRLDWTVYRNGSLWTAQTIFLPASGTPNRSSVQWWQIDTAGGRPRQNPAAWTDRRPDGAGVFRLPVDRRQ